jgi:hypothetical protein
MKVSLTMPLHAGTGMPGLGTALGHIKSVQATADRSNQVERFSYSLVNTLAKEHAAERARTPLARLLQLKQQRHIALLECLAAANAFVAHQSSTVCILRFAVQLAPVCCNNAL